MILEFCAAMNMTVGNTVFKKRANYLFGRPKVKPKKVFERYYSLFLQRYYFAKTIGVWF